MRKKKRLPSVNKGTHALCSLRVQELTIKDNFMFGAVMADEDNCKPFLQMVLGVSIERVEARSLRNCY